MKQKYLFFITVFIFVFAPRLTGSDLELLRITPPNENTPPKKQLLVNVDDVEKMIQDFTVDKVPFNIELADMGDKVLARLGVVKKGKIKWSHKTQDASHMLVKFNKKDLRGLWQQLQANPLDPGLQIILSSKGNEVLKSFRVSTVPAPDLTVEIRYPIKVMPGEELKDKLLAAVRNLGTAGSGSFHVSLAIKTDNRQPIELGSFSYDPTKTVTAQSDREMPGEFKPKESLTLNMAQSVKLPPETPPGRYSLQAKIDPQDRVKESNETNNTFKGLLLVTIPEPKSLVLHLEETRLRYDPATFSLTVFYKDTVISDGKEWRKCTIKPHIYQIRHASWKDFHWEIDTYDKSVWRITGAKFCQKGGSEKELKIAVLATGGSKTKAPTTIELKLPATYLSYEPSQRKFEIVSHGNQIAYTPFWQTCKLESHLYQVKKTDWQDLFWQADIFKKEVTQISKGKFCQSGSDGSGLPLPIEVTVEK